MLEARLGSPPSVDLYKAPLYSSRKNILYFLFNSYTVNCYILAYTHSRQARSRSIGRKGAALGAGAEVGAEDDITVASIRFKLAVELNIYLELIEKACILLRI